MGGRRGHRLAQVLGRRLKEKLLLGCLRVAPQRAARTAVLPSLLDSGRRVTLPIEVQLRLDRFRGRARWRQLTRGAAGLATGANDRSAVALVKVGRNIRHHFC